MLSRAIIKIHLRSIEPPKRINIHYRKHITRHSVDAIVRTYSLSITLRRLVQFFWLAMRFFVKHSFFFLFFGNYFTVVICFSTGQYFGQYIWKTDNISKEKINFIKLLFLKNICEKLHLKILYRNLLWIPLKYTNKSFHNIQK